MENDGTPQDLTNTAWALAKLAVNNAPFFEYFADASVRNLYQFDPQNCANAVWSVAAVLHKQLKFCDAVAERTIASIEQFGMQEVANVAWGMAHLGYVHAPLLHTLARKAMTELPRGAEQNLTNTAWAYAQLKFGSTTLFRCIAREVVERVGNFRSRDISITAWSFARMEIRDDDLVDVLAEGFVCKLRDDLGGWTPQELSNMTWSFAVLDVRNCSLLDSTATATLALGAQEFKQQELTNMLWAHASLRYRHADVLAAFVIQARESLSQYSVQNLVSAAGAFQVLSWHEVDRECIALREIVRRFAAVDHGTAPGVECVLLASAVEKVPELCKETESLGMLMHAKTFIVEPTLQHLSMLQKAETSTALDWAHDEMQAWVEKMQIPHLGPSYTRAALTAVSISPAPRESAWPAEARGAVLEAAWWSCPHAAVSSQGVVAWCSWRLHLASPESRQLEEPGRVFFANDSAESVLIGRLLQPIFIQVPRGGHAERRALLELLRGVMRELSAGKDGAWPQVRGKVCLYASHYPCISCLASLARFRRLLPEVTIEVEFDDASEAWSDRPIASVPNAQLFMGRTAERVESR
eukprot:TRINITY_DN74509_c0_g1_i1.p1 TRINITY_DN74509_c0_g1~~TRINITY_DN74509_c0_g1_i1.p1  ORF type:complete len:665 (+),score=96.96 TRINITY_DN74509_c0_g1_i1:247-1995(+)